MAKHPRWVALACGLLAALGFPPVHAWPLTLVGVAGLVWLVWRADTPRRAFALGWVFGLAHFTLANNWIATAFTYQAQMPAALGWLAVPLLSLYLALYPAVAAWGAHLLLGRKAPLWRFGLLLAGCWIVAEWLRSWVFTGYAWDPLGLVLLGGWDRPGIAVLLPWLGTYALSGLAVALAAAAAAFLTARRYLPLAALALALVAGMYWPAGKGAEGYLAFTLVQPNLRQEELNDPAKFEEQFARIAQLSANTAGEGNRLVLWPESAVPDYLRDGYPQRYYDQLTAQGDPAFARRRIGRAIGPGSLLLTGTVDLQIADNTGYPRAVGAYNTVTPITAEGTLGQRYAKSHLVPFGEYLPLRALLEPLGASRLVAGSIDFIPGPGPQTINLGPWGKVGPQICYEIVFSGQVVEDGNRPDYIFNPSNDGWFGAWGPPQHLAQARLRALEEGLPVLRSTTTGISAVIDARGVVRSHIARHRADRIDGFVPPAAAPTWFSVWGNWLPLAWAVILIAGSLVATRRLDR